MLYETWVIDNTTHTNMKKKFQNKDETILCVTKASLTFKLKLYHSYYCYF